MKHSLLKLSALTAAIVGTGVAFAAFTNTGNDINIPSRATTTTETVTAKWAMAVAHDQVAAEITPAGFFTNPTFTIGDGLTYIDVWTAQGHDLTRYKIPTCTEGGLKDNQYLEFTVTPTSAVSLKSISFDMINSGWGDGRINYIITTGTQTKSENTLTPTRQDKNYDESAVTFTCDLSEFTATTEPISLKIYYYSRNAQENKEREFGIANVTITGTAEVTDNCHFSVPGTLALTANDSEIEANKLRVGNNELSYVENGSTLTFKNVHVHQSGTYKVLMPTNYSYGDGTLKIEVKDLTSGKIEAEYDGTLPRNNSSYEAIEYTLGGGITDGTKDITFTFGRPSGFVCNARSPEFVRTGDYSGEVSEVPAGWASIPGTLDAAKWTYNKEGHGNFGFESEAKGVGYVKNKAVATYKFYNTEAGAYTMGWKWNISNGGTARITITDQESGEVEIDQNWTIAGGDNEIPLEGLITKGKKDISLALSASHDRWIGNYFSPVFTRTADSYAAVKSVSLDATEVLATEAAGFDWAFNLPMSFAAESLTLRANVIGGTVTATGEGVTAGSEAATFTITTPAVNDERIVTLTLTPEEGAAYAKTEYKVRIYRIGDVKVAAIAIDGINAETDIIEAINTSEARTATLSGNIYTAAPAVTATFIDATTATGKLESVTEGTAKYTFTGGEGEAVRTFTLNVEGIHIYERTEDDLVDTIVYDSSCNKADNSWSNGLYTIAPVNDGWGGSQFKFSSKNGYTITLTAPKDKKLKQIVLVKLFDNYADGKFTSATSEGAQVWCPTNAGFRKGGENAYNLIVNIEGHVPGTPVVFNFENGSQPVAWFEIIYEDANPGSAPELVKTEQYQDHNHALIELTFDREMTSTTATINGNEVTAEGGSATLIFPAFDLEYAAQVNLSIAAGAAKDKFGNSNASAITHSFLLNAKPVYEPIADENFVEVTNVAELREAVARANETNKTADAKPFVIFVRNGDYDLGTDVVNGASPSESSVCLHINKAWNVSLIGESRDGVLIHGTRTGISNPIFSTRYSHNTYIADLTLRNDFDYNDVVAGGSRKGVSVAHYGGYKDIMVNVTMQAVQDTQVTGEDGYYYNCDIYGGTDFICGGGDHFYDRCNLIIVSAGPITAPETSPSLKHGYVFQNCVISGKDGYTLGRPWQNEPRAFFLNTTMKAKCADAGWIAMSNVKTHFYEYNSMDAEGNPIDLSVRRNSPTSLNTYSPILDAKYAPYFIVENVIGLKESYLPTDYAVELAAPNVVYSNGAFSWEAVEDAVAYIIYCDGNYVTKTTSTTWSPSNAEPAALSRAAVPTYTVQAISHRGAKGAASTPMTSTGISDITADGAAGDVVATDYFNAQGQRVTPDTKGFRLRVETLSDGSRRVIKENAR